MRVAGGDTMNYWITGFREELLKTIAGWDFLLINDGEARLLSGETNLKKAAEAVATQHEGVFPSTKGEVLALPGIGPYTAGAIMAFAYNKPEVMIGAAGSR